MTLAEEIRAEFARIRRRYEGIDDAIASIRVSTVEKIEDYIEQSEERAASCTCAPVKGFEIDTSRTDARPYEIMAEAAIERMRGQA